mmetsp:Transcript_9255/g.16311  ORF Transcript_9255/g.16311 Transcript_9255/m.16311 type:complete len:432 (+) Transcript_9255:36-1331(+)
MIRLTAHLHASCLSHVPPLKTHPIATRHADYHLRQAIASRALSQKGVHHRAMDPNKQQPQQELTRLVIIGDVHGAWSATADLAALKLLNPSMCIFLGDFGNEDVELVSQVASLELPKAVILGNHDAWNTMTPRRLRQPPPPLPGETPAAPANAVLEQLRLLGPSHVGFGACQVPGDHHVSIVGARPFSRGGKYKETIRAFIAGLYEGIDSEEASAQKIVLCTQQEMARGNSVVLVSHNAPLGCGNDPWSISGIDWTPGGGDHGDPDLRTALDIMTEQGIKVPLVLCGHMHHRTQGGGHRRMVHMDTNGTLILNAATVPRVRRAPAAAGQSPRKAVLPDSPEDPVTWRHFLCVDLQQGPSMGKVVSARDVWVAVSGPPQTLVAEVMQTQELVRQREGQAGTNWELWDAHLQRWSNVFIAEPKINDLSISSHL